MKRQRLIKRWLDELFDSIGELVIAQNYLGENTKIKAIADAEVTKTIENLSKITRLIQNRVMSLRMIPFPCPSCI